MKSFIYSISLFAMLSVAAVPAYAQQSVSSTVSRKSDTRAASTKKTGVSDRARGRMSADGVSATDADLAWMKVVYRSLDLQYRANAALYFPEQSVDGQENLFRIMMRLLASGELTAYEYLDGREAFTDEYRLKVRDMLDRFHIYYTEGKGYSEKRQVFDIEESDIPSTEVLGYYMVERWEFDRRAGRMRTKVEALCPVLHRSEEFGHEAVRYPMFWVRYADIRPYLAGQLIFTDDDNNLPQSTYDDYFNLGLYKGEIYKTRNLRNKSMAQLYPDPEDLKHAQDSIENRLKSFDKNIWVPSLEEMQSKAGTATAANDSIAPAKKSTRKISGTRVSSKRPSKRVKSSSVKSGSTATRSVRNRKR